MEPRKHSDIIAPETATADAVEVATEKPEQRTRGKKLI